MTTRVEVRGRLTRVTLRVIGLRPEERVRLVRTMAAAALLLLVRR